MSTETKRAGQIDAGDMFLWTIRTTEDGEELASECTLRAEKSADFKIDRLGRTVSVIAARVITTRLIAGEHESTAVHRATAKGTGAKVSGPHLELSLAN